MYVKPLTKKCLDVKSDTLKKVGLVVLMARKEVDTEFNCKTSEKRGYGRPKIRWKYNTRMNIWVE
jgi:hypothetical protein